MSLGEVRKKQMAIKDGRQIGPTLDDIRVDHVERYLLAANLLKPGWRVLDIACGVGYGSYLMATRVPGVHVDAIDIAEDAMEYARKYYTHSNVRYFVGDALSCELNKGYYDAIVSFETLEHLTDDRRFLDRLHESLRAGGRLILSSPNEDTLSFNRSDFPYHVRHYRSREMEQLLGEAGFAVLVRLSQTDRERGSIRPGFGGAFNIAVCCKSEKRSAQRHHGGSGFRVEVGAGDSPSPGYVHCDVRPLPHIEHVCIAWELPFASGSVDEIYSRHMLEHLTFDQAKRTLAHWAEMLRPGGVLDINVPDLEAASRQLNLEGLSPYVPHQVTNEEHALRALYGWQNHPDDFHRSGYTESLLRRALSEAGFDSIRKAEDTSLSGPVNLRLEAHRAS